MIHRVQFNWKRTGEVPLVQVRIIDSIMPVQPQAITLTNADQLSIGLLGTYATEIWIKLYKKKNHSTKRVWKCNLQNDGHLFRYQCF